MKRLLLTLSVLVISTALSVEFSGGDGTKDSPYQISNYTDIQELWEKVNSGTNYSNKYFNVTREINYDGEYHTPIGASPLTPFCGSFDGNKLFITGYTIEGSDCTYCGFFGYLGAGAIITDLYLGGHIELNISEAHIYAGSVAGWATNATITRCTVEGAVTVNGTRTYAGGIVGYSYDTKLTSLKVENTASVTAYAADGAYAGGIAGVTIHTSGLEPITISGCKNEAPVHAESLAGNSMAAGIAGRCADSISECSNEGDITATFGELGVAAGIVGYAPEANTTIVYVINEGAVTSRPCERAGVRGPDLSYAAGIVGFFEKEFPAVTSAHNFGHVTAHTTTNLHFYAAGIAGGLEESATVSAVRNDGNVTAIAPAGKVRVYGIIGGLVADAERNCLIINSHNAGPVRALSEAKYCTFIMGGVAGELVTNTVIRNSFNTGDVLSESKDPMTYEYIAGIAGIIGAESTIDNCYTLAHIAWSQSTGLVDLDVVGALVGNSVSTYITNSYWLYSSRYKPVGRGICDNCGSFDEYGVMIEDSVTQTLLYEVLNRRIDNDTDYRTWVQGHDHPAEFDCMYFSHRVDSCEAHSHCVLADKAAGNYECVYAPCSSFEYSTCGAQECERCDVEWNCRSRSSSSSYSLSSSDDTCTSCSSYTDEDSCSSAGITNRTEATRCKWCEVNNLCMGIGFRCKAFRGNGTEDDPYRIETVGDFNTIRRAVEGGISFEHMHFAQLADLDFAGAEVRPIGDETRQFRGTYDGRKHKISGFVVNGSYKHAGLFGYLGYEGMITNLRVNGTVATTTRNETAYAGGVVGFAYANVVNCRNYGPVSAVANGGYAYAGGIVGYAEFGAVAKTINTGRVYARGTNDAGDVYVYAGGVAGYIVSDFYLEKCFNLGEVVADGLSSFTRLYAGGIAGYIAHENYVINSLNLGNILAAADPANAGTVRAAAGGVAGECDYSNYVMNFGNHGNVSIITNVTTDGSYTTSIAGGFFGGTSASNVIENSYALGDIYAYTPNKDDMDYSAIGGLVGIATRGSYIRNSYFSGDVVLDTYLTNYHSYAGALIGYSTYDSIENCYWRYDPELDSFGAGACTNCTSFDKYDVIAEDTNDPTYLFQALNDYLDPAAGNHTSTLPGAPFLHWAQGITHFLPAGFECASFSTAADFCAGAEFCFWNSSAHFGDGGDGYEDNFNENGTCEYRPCADFSYETCNAPQCRACDYSQVCIDASDTETPCVPCAENEDEYTCNAIPVCHWCPATGVCFSDTHTCTGFEGNGTEESPYIVRSTFDLQTIQTNVNSGISYAGRHFELINNLVLKDIVVDPIGTASNPFRGVFNGAGHIVSGYTVKGSTHPYVGFFGYVGEGGAVRNFRVNGTLDVESYHYDVFAGGVVGYAYRANISGCHNYGTVRSYSDTGYSYAGGIVGYSEGSSVTGCYNTARITSVGVDTSCCAGGIVADSESDHPVDHCFNDATVETSIQSRYQRSVAGGIAGVAKFVSNSFNRGPILVASTMTSFTNNGGIVGIATSGGNVTNCFNHGTIVVESNASYAYSYTGGIAGSTYGAGVDNCYSSGSIYDKSSSATVGALIGTAYHEASIARCYYPAGSKWNVTGVNATCKQCAAFDKSGDVAATLNSAVTAENGYATWTAVNTTATFTCDYFNSITSDACTRARYCSWCFVTSTCAEKDTCITCEGMRSMEHCHVYPKFCSWCEDESMCKVADADCVTCKVLDNVTCGTTSSVCHFCADDGVCIARSKRCPSDKDGNDSTKFVIILISTIAAIVLLIVILASALAVSNARNRNTGYKNLSHSEVSDTGFSNGNAPLLINDDMQQLHAPAYISQSHVFSVDRTVAPQVSVADICAKPKAVVNLNSALREAGFTDTQTTILMAASLDKAAAAAASGGASNGLSQEEAQALALLTYDAGAGSPVEDENPFALVNAALREGSVQSVEPVRGLVGIMVSALDKIVPMKNKTVYHGLLAKVSYEKNAVINWPEFMCAAVSLEAVKEGLTDGGKPTGTIFTINDAKVYNLKSYSFSPDSPEVFLRPGARFKVVDVSSSLDLNIINLEMIN